MTPHPLPPHFKHPSLLPPSPSTTPSPPPKNFDHAPEDVGYPAVFPLLFVSEMTLSPGYHFVDMRPVYRLISFVGERVYKV